MSRLEGLAAEALDGRRFEDELVRSPGRPWPVASSREGALGAVLFLVRERSGAYRSLFGLYEHAPPHAWEEVATFGAGWPGEASMRPTAKAWEPLAEIVGWAESSSADGQVFLIPGRAAAGVDRVTPLRPGARPAVVSEASGAFLAFGRLRDESPLPQLRVELGGRREDLAVR